MDEELKEKIQGLTPKQIIEKIENNEISDDYEIQQIALSFTKDEDKMALIKYVWPPNKIIRSLKEESNILKSLGRLSDRNKVAIVLDCIKDEANRMKAIEMFADKDEALPIEIALSKEKFKEYFPAQEEKKYQQIGLDKKITIGLEIESIGKNSEKILRAGKSNGIVKHSTKGLECGKLFERR